MLRPAVAPARTVKMGKTVLLEPLSAAKHAADLWEAQDVELWRYLPDGPFPSREAFDEAIAGKEGSQELLFWAIVDRATGKARGCAAVMSVDLKNAVSEIGHVLLTKSLQQTRQATEAFFLFLCICFDEMVRSPPFLLSLADLPRGVGDACGSATTKTSQASEPPCALASRSRECTGRL